VFATLLDEGVYLASVATLYRVLRENRQVTERRRLARHPARTRPELIATGPGQVFSWDITKLPGPSRGVYYDAYVMIDIYSRYIVGCKVAATESAALAEDFIIGVFAVHGVPQVVHADRGTSMTSKKVADLLADLHVLRSHSRPHVSNDNPYSEAAFKTVKYHPASRAGSGRSSTRGRSATRFSPGTTTNTTTPGSGCTPRPTCTMATPEPSRSNVQLPWPRPVLLTPSASPPPETRRSSRCPPTPGSTLQ